MTEDYESRSESSEPDLRKLPAKSARRKLIRPGELIIGALFIAVVAVLLITLINKLTLKHDVSNARTVSDKVIADIQKRDGAAIHSLGSPNFQRTYSATSLTQDFKSVEIATLKAPALDHQIAIDTPSGRDVYFIYKYTALKVPFYVRTGIAHRSGHWYLVSIDGNIDESQLTGN
jgi:hypothetical protein